MGRKNRTGFPDFMMRDGDRGGFVIVNPVTGKKTRFSPQEEQTARQTAALLAKWVEKRRQRLAFEKGLPTIRMLVERFREERLPWMPWDEETRYTYGRRLLRIENEKGAELVDTTDVTVIGEWLNKTAVRADPFNKWRHTWLLLFQLAVSLKWAKANEAEKVIPRSTSKKIDSNKKVRSQFDVEGFLEVYRRADPWLQLAMDISLVTLQSREQVVLLQHSDFRDGFVYFIRDKVAGDSSMAFIRIRVTTEIDAFQARARKLDSIACPYLVHRKPERMQRRWTTDAESKAHWAAVTAQYLTKAFAEVVASVPRYAAMPARKRPPFHEIRGLGARQMKLMGLSRQKIQELATHSSPETTEIYLEFGPEALTDEHFKKVDAPFTARELLA